MQLFSYRCWVQPQPWLRLQQLSQFLLLNAFSLQALKSSLIHRCLLPANNPNFWSTKEEINWLGLNKRVAIIFALVGDTANKWDRPITRPFFPVSPCNKSEKKLGAWSSGHEMAPTSHKTKSIMLGDCKAVIAESCIDWQGVSCSTSPLSSIPVLVPALTACPGRRSRKEIIHFLIRLWRVRSKYHIS